MGTYWSQNALTRCPKGLCLLLLLIAGIFPLASHAQNAGININLTDKPLSAFIQSIEQQTDFKFFYGTTTSRRETACHCKCTECIH